MGSEYLDVVSIKYDGQQDAGQVAVVQPGTAITGGQDIQARCVCALLVGRFRWRIWRAALGNEGRGHPAAGAVPNAKGIPGAQGYDIVREYGVVHIGVEETDFTTSRSGQPIGISHDVSERDDVGDGAGGARNANVAGAERQTGGGCEDELVVGASDGTKLAARMEPDKNGVARVNEAVAADDD